MSAARPPRPLEPGDIVDIKPKCHGQVRKVFQFGPLAQFRVLEVAKRTPWMFAMVRIGRTPTDTDGHWLWKKQLHRVASKKIAPEWQTKKAT